jgi:hypothetical protein
MPLNILKTLEELTVSTCRWPVAEFERNVLLYRGEPAEAAADGKPKPFCRHHAQIAYIQPAALRLPTSVTHERIALAREKKVAEGVVDRVQEITEAIA